MRQRLHRRYQDERSEVEIGNVDLATMGIEITTTKRTSVACDSTDIFERPGAESLFIVDREKSTARRDTESVE